MRIYRNTPEDKSWLAMCFMMSKKESDEKSVNVKRGLKTKAEKGWLPSGAKPGYMNDKYAEKGNKTILSDPIRFPLIKKSWELFLTGTYTVAQIHRMLNEDWEYRTPVHRKSGGKPMSRSMLYKVFTDTFYYGEFEYPIGSGIYHIGQHEPMITKDDFDRAQVLLGRKGRPRPKKHSHDYIGLMSCGECGAAITAEEKWQIICPGCKYKFHSPNKDRCPKCQLLIEEMKNPKILHYIFYHCTKRKDPGCSQGGLEVKQLEIQVDDILKRIQIPERFLKWAIKYLNYLNDEEVIDRNATLQAVQCAYDDCIKKIDNLLELKISPQNTDGSLLSDDEYKFQKNRLFEEKNRLEEKLKNTGHRIEKWVELSEKTFDFACHARYWFANGDSQTKREIFHGLGQNLTLMNKILLPNLEEPLQFIEKMKEQEKTII